MSRTGPLSGIRVLDLSRVLAGPIATQMLGDFGADVIKVEAPEGDDSRGYGPHFATDTSGRPTRESGFYLSANRNKRSIICDFATSEGRERILALARGCDVVVENFRPGSLARHGLGHEDIHRINPRAIYASLTGFGQDSPYATRPGYDAIFQAQGGWMSVTGEPEGPWSKTGPSLVDVFSGINLVAAITAALYHRDARGGAGQHIDLALYDCAIAAMSHVAGNYLVSRESPQRLGTAGNGGAPSDVYPCADGMIYISSGRQEHYERLCHSLQRPDLIRDPRFADAMSRFTNRVALGQQLADAMRDRRKSELIETLSAAGVPVAPLNDLDEVFTDPHVAVRGMLVTMDHGLLGQVDLVGNPIHFGTSPVSYRLPPPTAGEHDADITWLDEAS